jgi:hypothetical protein
MNQAQAEKKIMRVGVPDAGPSFLSAAGPDRRWFGCDSQATAGRVEEGAAGGSQQHGAYQNHGAERARMIGGQRRQANRSLPNFPEVRFTRRQMIRLVDKGDSQERVEVEAKEEAGRVSIPLSSFVPGHGSLPLNVHASRGGLRQLTYQCSSLRQDGFEVVLWDAVVLFLSRWKSNGRLRQD